METDEKWMRVALDLAEQARTAGEVPIGACLISESSELIAAGFNRTITDCDPTAHAEIVVLRDAARRIGNYRLAGTTLYTTVEPCVMCAGALVNAWVKRLVFGTPDERFGAVGSLFQLCDNAALNHRLEITPGVLKEECRSIMQEFFRARRA